MLSLIRFFARYVHLREVLSNHQNTNVTTSGIIFWRGCHWQYDNYIHRSAGLLASWRICP
jgi:hypothetical protein